VIRLNRKVTFERQQPDRNPRKHQVNQFINQP